MSNESISVEPCDVTLDPLQNPVLDFPEDPADQMPDSIWDSLQPWTEEEEVRRLLTFYYSEYRQRSEYRDDVAASFHFRILGNENEFSFEKALRYIYSKLERSFNASVACTVLLRKPATEAGEKDEFMIFFGQASGYTFHITNKKYENLATVGSSRQPHGEEPGDLRYTVARKGHQGFARFRPSRRLVCAF